ncbi:RhoGAP domain containing protein [Entamoeba marina]
MKCKEVSQKLGECVSSIKMIESDLNSISKIVPSNNQQYNMHKLVQKSSSYQVIIADNIRTISSFYERMRNDFESNIILDKLQLSDYSETHEFQEIQRKNIYRYNALTSFCVRADKLFPSFEKCDGYEETNKKITKEFKDNVTANTLYKGNSLEQILVEEHLPSNRMPIAIERIMTSLFYSSQSKQTLFRLSIDTDRLNNLYNDIRLIETRRMSNTELSSLLKKFIRDLPEPIWPEDLLYPLVKVMETDCLETIIENMKKLIKKLPDANKTFIGNLLCLCEDVINSKNSKMSSQSIAVCLAPGLMRKQDMSFTSIAVVAPVLNYAFSIMINQRKELFGITTSPFKKDCIQLYGSYQSVFEGSEYGDIFHSNSADFTTNNLNLRLIGNHTRRRKATIITGTDQLTVNNNKRNSLS